MASAFFSMVALAALGASSSAAPAVCNGLTNHPLGIAGVPLFAKFDGGWELIGRPIVGFLAGGPTLSITVPVD